MRRETLIDPIDKRKVPMAKRITIMLDEKLEKKIRNIQASMIKKLNTGISFSEVMNQILQEGLQKSKYSKF